MDYFQLGLFNVWLEHIDHHAHHKGLIKKRIDCALKPISVQGDTSLYSTHSTYLQPLMPVAKLANQRRLNALARSKFDDSALRLFDH